MLASRMALPVLVLALQALVGAGPATVDERIDRAQAALAALEYNEAADDLLLVLADPAATDAQKLRANMIAGIANRVIGRDVDARINFRSVLEHDRDARLPDGTAPKVAAFFEMVRQELEADRAAVPAAPPTPSAPPAADKAAAIPFAGLTAGAGVVAVAAGVSGVVAAELTAADPTALGADREAAIEGGRVFVALTAVGVAAAAVGGVWWALSP